MRLTEAGSGGAVPVAGYGPGFFRIGREVIRGPLLVWAGGTAAWGGMADIAGPLALAGVVDVVLVGTGAAIAPLPAALRAALEGAGIGVEPMSSPAACRTYNVLLGEGRRVAAALLPVE